MPIELNIVTPQGEAYRGPVEGVVLPGSEGEFGVLPAHERFLTPLKVGALEIRTASETLYAAVADGFADVSSETLTVLVESCELAAKIDLARAEMAQDRASQGLSDLEHDGEAERAADFEAALERARNRIAVAGRR